MKTTTVMLLVFSSCGILFFTSTVFAENGGGGTSAGGATAAGKSLLEEAQGFQGWLKERRRELHQTPELCYAEVVTSAYLHAQLQQYESSTVKITTGWGVNRWHEEEEGQTDKKKSGRRNGNLERKMGKGGTGIVVDIGSGKKPCVAIRADIDGLPIEEESQDLPYRSVHAGRMHACGHDVHMTMLLGAVRLLASRSSSLLGTIRVVFQPAEEGGAGANRMVEEGLITKSPEVDWMFGMHVSPIHSVGVVAGRPGVMLAGCDRISISVNGSGGHAAAPFLATDPLLAATKIVDVLYSVVAREFTENVEQYSGLVTIGAIQAGSASNIIPTTASLVGTIRSATVAGLARLRSRVVEVADAIAKAHKCTATVQFGRESLAPVLNDPSLWNDFTRKVAGDVAHVELASMFMGSEDFATYSHLVPSSFIWIGSRGDPSAVGTDHFLHTPLFNVDENVLPIGAAMHAHWALQALQQVDQWKDGARQKVVVHEEDEL
eukprot:GHVS01063503.1.p1 GENE.GHVS01063503.1~~GHVS01063503.1.p1  ORF type:complete len:491 (+),score=89.40 GHVS01063503.1:127-1599(+)